MALEEVAAGNGQQSKLEGVSTLQRETRRRDGNSAPLFTTTPRGSPSAAEERGLMSPGPVAEGVTEGRSASGGPSQGPTASPPEQRRPQPLSQRHPAAINRPPFGPSGGEGSVLASSIRRSPLGRGPLQGPGSSGPEMAEVDSDGSASEAGGDRGVGGASSKRPDRRTRFNLPDGSGDGPGGRGEGGRLGRGVSLAGSESLQGQQPSRTKSTFKGRGVADIATGGGFRDQWEDYINRTIGPHYSMVNSAHMGQIRWVVGEAIGQPGNGT